MDAKAIESIIRGGHTLLRILSYGVFILVISLPMAHTQARKQLLLNR